jgi:hypothetical protein
LVINAIGHSSLLSILLILVLHLICLFTVFTVARSKEGLAINTAQIDNNQSNNQANKETINLSVKWLRIPTLSIETQRDKAPIRSILRWLHQVVLLRKQPLAMRRALPQKPLSIKARKTPKFLFAVLIFE